MKTIINPLDNDVSIVFNGDAYTVKANSTLEVNEDVAIFWIGIHGFLKIQKSEVKIAKETSVKEEVKEVVKKVVKKTK